MTQNDDTGVKTDQMPVANSQIIGILKSSGSHMAELCATYAAEHGPSCSVANIISGIMSQNQKDWEVQQAEICNDPKAGATVAEKLENAGLAEGTVLNCAPAKGPGGL